MSKKAKKSKTILFNTIGIAIEMLLVYVTQDIIPIPLQYKALALMILNAGANNLLRFATKEGVDLPFKKKETGKLS